jgi:hypothetical protein
MFDIFLLITLLFAFAFWIYRKHAVRHDHMGKKDDYEFFNSQRNSSWADTPGDELSFRRRM